MPRRWLATDGLRNDLCQAAIVTPNPTWRRRRGRGRQWVQPNGSARRHSAVPWLRWPKVVVTCPPKNESRRNVGMPPTAFSSRQEEQIDLPLPRDWRDYNEQRPHSSLGNLPRLSMPGRHERRSGEFAFGLDQRWGQAQSDDRLTWGLGSRTGAGQPGEGSATSADVL